MRWLNRVRKLCLALPGVVETVSYGHPTWQVGKRTFAVYECYRDRWSVAFLATLDQQREFIADSRFYVTPYSGKRGWTSLHLAAAPVAWPEVAQLLQGAWLLAAPLALRAELQSRPAVRRPRAKTKKR